MQKWALLAHGEDAKGALPWERDGRGRDGRGFQLGADVVEEDGVRKNVYKHIESRRDRVGEDAEQGADLEAALVPEREAIFTVHGVSGFDHCGAMRLGGDIIFKEPLECEAEGRSCVGALGGEEAREYI